MFYAFFCLAFAVIGIFFRKNLQRGTQQADFCYRDGGSGKYKYSLHPTGVIEKQRPDWPAANPDMEAAD